MEKNINGFILFIMVFINFEKYIKIKRELKVYYNKNYIMLIC